MKMVSANITPLALSFLLSLPLSCPGYTNQALAGSHLSNMSFELSCGSSNVISYTRNKDRTSMHHRIVVSSS